MAVKILLADGNRLRQGAEFGLRSLIFGMKVWTWTVTQGTPPRGYHC